MHKFLNDVISITSYSRRGMERTQILRFKNKFESHKETETRSRLKSDSEHDREKRNYSEYLR